MPKTCVVSGCRNTSSKEKAKTFSLHKYPQDRELGQKWDEFVRKTHPDFKTGNQTTVVCSDHFLEDDFINRGIFNERLAEKLLLKKGAIPSVAARQGDIQVGTPTMQSCPSGNITAPAVSSETSAVNLDDGLYQDKNIHMEASGPTQVDKAGTPPTERELAVNIKHSARYRLGIDNTTGDIVYEDQALNTSSCSSTQETSHSPYNAPSPIAVAGSANDFVLDPQCRPFEKRQQLMHERSVSPVEMEDGESGDIDLQTSTLSTPAIDPASLTLERDYHGGVDTEYPLTGTVPVEDTQNDHSLGSEDSVDNACREAAPQPSTSQASSRSQTPQPDALPKRKKCRMEHPQVTSAGAPQPEEGLNLLAAAATIRIEDRNRQQEEADNAHLRTLVHHVNEPR